MKYVHQNIKNLCNKKKMKWWILFNYVQFWKLLKKITELNFQHAVYKIKLRPNESLKMHIILVHSLVQLFLKQTSYFPYSLALSSVLNARLLVIEFQTSKVVLLWTSFHIIQCSCHKKDVQILNTNLKREHSAKCDAQLVYSLQKQPYIHIMIVYMLFC